MSDTTTTGKTRTITLTDRPPVTIREDDWPVIARADWWEGEYEFQSNRTAKLRVREHADGRRIIYGVATSQWQGERDRHAGVLVVPLQGLGGGVGTALHTRSTVVAI